MSMSRKKCCVPGCLDSGNSHPTLHLFPNPAKDKGRFDQWVYSIGGDIIGMDDQDIYIRRSVCHAHFEEKFCCRFNRISNIAVPTLNLPGPLSIPKLTLVERRPLRQVQNYSTSPMTSASTVVLPTTTIQYTMASSPMPSTSTSSTGLSMKLSSTFKSISVPGVDTTNIENIEPDRIPQPALKKSNPEFIRRKTVKSSKKYVTPEVHKLQQKLIQLRIKVSKSRNKMKRQSISLKAARSITSNPVLLAALEKMPNPSMVLTMMQFKGVGKKSKGRRFNLEEKILALSIMKHSPKSYRFLRKMFILPAPQTLSKLINQANVKPGINKKIFTQLKSVAEKMKPEERLCILLFDEMFLKANISYNERKDRITGFVTDGTTTKPEFADHAQVYMIRGLIKNYKQPISYTFSAAATSGQEISKQIKENVTALQEAGFIVVATICDQGANNRQAIKLLLQETHGAYLRAGQDPKQNIILINNEEVVPLYDPPHLLKCIRNNLLTKNLEYISDGKKQTAKWDHLVLLHKENPGYKGIRLIPKLTDNHVLPEKLKRNKMKVKFASQIFSRTVATNMGYLADKGILPKECKETADILLFFDNLFDSQNGSYMKKNKNHAKPLLGPVTPYSIHHKEWVEAKRKLKGMRFIHPITRKIENIPTLNNWAWTFEGIEVLLKKMNNEYNVSSIWMRHLNQDPIENFFGAIRSHGCRNTNPTPENFENSFITMLINNMTSVYAPAGTNCERDLCKNLHAFIVRDDCEASAICDLQYLPNIIVQTLDSKNDPRIISALQYVSGYFTKMAKSKICKSCPDCSRNFVTNIGAEYIKYREYADRQWLCSPTDALLKCISEVQDINDVILKEYIEKSNLKELVKTHLLIHIDFDFIDCASHKNKLIEYLINVTSRFFIINYCKEINKILSGKRDCQDDEGNNLKIKAKKYYKKCCKRPKNK